IRVVIPAKAGIQVELQERTPWIPAFAGMTRERHTPSDAMLTSYIRTVLTHHSSGRPTSWMLCALVALLSGCATAPVGSGFNDVPESDWIELFNGRDLRGWTVKVHKHDVGVNFGDTFRVEDGMIQVRYDQYG